MLILPAIDLREGRCVRLIQGDYDRESSYDSDPVSVAKSFEDAGADILHVVDLDAAKTGHPHELPVIARIVRALKIPVEVGGGVRSLQAVRELLDVGVARAICGTALVKTPGLAENVFAEYGAAIVAGIDCRQGKVAVSGWTDQTAIGAAEFAKSMVALGCARIIVTDIDRDGMLNGPNLELLAEISRATNVPVVQSGGIGSLDHVREVFDQGIAEGLIIGRALYEGQVRLREAVEMAHANCMNI